MQPSSVVQLRATPPLGVPALVAEWTSSTPHLKPDTLRQRSRLTTLPELTAVYMLGIPVGTRPT
jgi:hypothetical protein